VDTDDVPVVGGRRSLKGSSTRSPTHVPAPVLPQDDDGLQWSTLVLIAEEGQSWYHTSQLSTSYYISDLAGHRLFYTGTACSDIIETNSLECDISLPDGQYVLRFGGAVRSFTLVQDALDWQFCGFTGMETSGAGGSAIQQQLIFDVIGNVCIPYSLTYVDDICIDTSPDLQFDVSIILSGVSESALTSADISGLEAAVASVLGVDASHMKLASRNQDVFIFHFSTDVSKFGFDSSDAEDSIAAMEYFDGIITDKSGHLLMAIKQMCAASGHFEALAHVTLESGKLVGVVEHVSTKTAVDQAEFVQGEVSASVPVAHTTFSDKVVSSYAFPTSVLGYVLVACSVLFVAYLVKSK
jgi:hypothetical protein